MLRLFEGSNMVDSALPKLMYEEKVLIMFYLLLPVDML